MQAKHPDILKRIRFSDVMKLFGENVQEIKKLTVSYILFSFSYRVFLREDIV